MGSGASRGSKPTVYYAAFGAPSRAVLFTAQIANIQLDKRHVDLMKQEQLHEDFIKINPEHTIPTLVDGELNLWESRAILTYLVDKYAPGHSIYPKSHETRARINRLLYCDLSFVAHHINAFMFPQLMQQQLPDADLQRKVEKVLDYLEGILHEDFFVGGSVTIGDISIMASLSVLEANDWQFERWPKVNEWRHRMKSLPHYEEINKPWDEFMQANKQQQSRE